HSSVHGRSSDSLSYLEMAARQLGDDELAATWTREVPDRAWGVPWAHWAPVSPHRVLASSGQPRAFAINAAFGRAVVVAGCEDGVIRVWDLASGELHGQPLRGHDIRVTSVQVGEVLGRMIIASGAFDGSIRTWDLMTGESIGHSLQGHAGQVTGLAIGKL